MSSYRPVTIITQNSKMRAIISKINRISDTNSSILLIGETGVGKEVFAEYIHRTSNRNQNNFVKIGLAALPTDLMASELFGHEKGSFTSAMNKKMGLFELAHNGSIFLDDIDDVPIEIQTKLLRVLESRELMRIGGTKSISIDIRLISASKVDLKEIVKKKQFRADLYYRINVVPITIPPLRERKEDIPLLVEYFIKKFALNKLLTVSKSALNALINYTWPGNVRELRNVIHHASLFADNEITINDLPSEIAQNNHTDYIIKSCGMCFDQNNVSFNHIIECVGSNLLNETLRRTNGNQSEAAKILGLSLSTFRDKVKKHKKLQQKSCNVA